MPSDTLLTGSSTVPSVKFFDFSGFRVDRPPLVTANCVAQSLTPSPVVGQRNGSLAPCGVTLCVCGAYRPCRLGARKPRPYDVRSSTCAVGCQRRLTLGVVEAPTPS